MNKINIPFWALFYFIISRPTLVMAETVTPLPPQESFFKEVAKVVSLAAGNLVFAAAVTASIISALPTLWPYLSQPIFLFGSRKRKSILGTVYNSLTKEPIAQVAVKVFDYQYKKLLRIILSTKDGKFSFFIPPGEYFLKALKKGYLFPSQIITTSPDGKYQHIYRGEVLKIEEGQVADFNIPLDPDDRKKPSLSTKIDYFLEKIRIPLLVCGTLTALYLVFSEPSALSYLLLGFYLLLWTLEVLIEEERSRWFVVKDAMSRIPLEFAIVRVFKEKDKLVTTLVTDALGRFFPLLDPGLYQLEIKKANYHSAFKLLKIKKGELPKGLKVLLLRK